MIGCGIFINRLFRFIPAFRHKLDGKRISLCENIFTAHVNIAAIGFFNGDIAGVRFGLFVFFGRTARKAREKSKAH